MLLPLANLADAWDAIRGVPSLPQLPATPDGNVSGPVLIFVSSDVDSAAATRTLTGLLKIDLVRYEVHPVTGYSHLSERFISLTQGDHAVGPRAVLCVNCGGCVDLAKILHLDDVSNPPPIYVIDSHRPFHLRNLSADVIVVLDDDDENFDDRAFPLDLGVEDEFGNVSDHDLSDSESDESSSSSDDSDEDDAKNDDERKRGEDEYSESERSVDSEVDEEEPESDADSEAIDAAANGNTGETQATDATDGPSSGVVEDSSSIVNGNGMTANGVTQDSESGGGTKRSRDGETQESNGVSSRRRRRGRTSKRRRSGDKNDRTVAPSGKEDRKRGRRKRKRRNRVHVDPEEKEKIRDYYANNFLAMSSACLSHNLASLLRRAGVDTLWLAMVGVTSQYINAGVSEDCYADAVNYFRSQIAHVIPPPSSNDGSENQLLDNVGYSTSTSAELKSRVLAPSLELRLDLLRNWNLYESLLHSSYTITRLAAWKEGGIQRMKELLATLGIPLRESQSPFLVMSAECKEALDDRLINVVRRFDLGNDIQYQSFVRSLPGHRGVICAADVVHSVMGSLEFGVGDLSERFWRAYDVLDANNEIAWVKGLKVAIHCQKLVSTIVNDVMERRKFVASGPFRYTFLRDQQAHGVIAKPLLLRRVALFLIAALTRQGARNKPFVVLAPDTNKGTWIAVAATSVGRRNDFGVRFQKAAEKNGSNVVYAGFDSAVCEIDDGQEVEFVRFLHDVLR